MGIQFRQLWWSHGGHQRDAARRRHAGAPDHLHDHGFRCCRIRSRSIFRSRIRTCKTQRTRRIPSGCRSARMVRSIGTIRRLTSLASRPRSAVIAQQSNQPELQIDADDAAQYEAVARVLSDAKGQGLTKIGFVNSN